MPSKPLRTSLRVRILTATISALVTLALIGIIWGPCTADYRAVPHDTTSSPADLPTVPSYDSVPYAWTNTPLELDVLEAVLRHQLGNNAVTGTARVGVDFFFIALGPGRPRLDPPDELLLRFESHLPRVVAARFADTSMPGISHKNLGGRGALLHIDSIRLIDADTVDVDGGTSGGSRSASGHSCRLRRIDGTWQVVGSVMRWIS